ncbi:MAG: sulfatase-like hydrolase/transferase [Bacteroidales bacterium]|nr:sulfatase-like hydrolase/transferase [Bacteroidales bacterium]
MQKHSIFTGNIYWVLLLKLAIILDLFWMSRLLLWVFNPSYFSELGFCGFFEVLFYGLRFDISALMMVNLPIIFLWVLPFNFTYNKIYQKITCFIFYLFNSIALAANFIDIIYFRFTLKRTSGDIFNYFANEDSQFLGLIPQFIIDFWYILLIWLAFIFLMIFLCKKIHAELRSSQKSTIKVVSSRILFFFLFLFISIIGIRGGFQLKPISIIHAGTYAEGKNLPLILNTPFSIIKTINQNALKSVKYFKKEEEAASIYSPVHKVFSDSLFEEFRNFNVVIIIMESFSSEHIAALNPKLDLESSIGNYKGFTPFLDSLINESLVFNGFANGKRSIEGIPAILSSIPTLMNYDFITSIYSGNKVSSIANLLKEKAYSTAFFHGGTNGTMGFEAFTKMAGFDKYYGRSEYNNENDYDGKWGIYDEEFFQYFANELNETKEPFLSVFFSLSSHHPYSIPEKHKNKFRKGQLEIHESIGYSDYSLGEFFKTASKMPWFENTLFVITADHTSENYYPEYQTMVGNYSIPIVFYKPNSRLQGSAETIAQQIDIMPSILSFLNYDKDFIAFGNDLFTAKSDNFAVSYLNGNYQLIKDDYVLSFNGKESHYLYNFKKDNLLKNNLIEKENRVVKEMEIFLKAIIQQYNDRMINNKLTND